MHVVNRVCSASSVRIRSAMSACQLRESRARGDRRLDLTVAYLSTVRPFDAAGLRRALRGTDVVLVEPYLAGTSAGEVADALQDRPHRLLNLGIRNTELRRYGSRVEHRAAHGLDSTGIALRSTSSGLPPDAPDSRCETAPGRGTTPARGT
jgi:transketolase C-terminal domain/subunit